ncbi:unnamed protein product [Ectocarpus sp. 8 AP-2014]
MVNYLGAHFYKARTESLWKFVDQQGSYQAHAAGR